MGYHTQQKSVATSDLRRMMAVEKPVVVREFLYDMRVRLKELRQRLYQLMRVTDGKSV